MAFLKERTDDEHNKITAGYLLDGRHMRAKHIPSKIMFKYNRALSKVFSRVEKALNDFVDGKLITKSTAFLDDWEKTTGIPDNSLPGTGDVESRRRQTQMKLSVEGVYSADDWVWICSIMGFIVQVIPGHTLYLSGDPRVSFATEKESKFTTVFEVDRNLSTPVNDSPSFPVSWPWFFYSNDLEVLKDFVLEYIDTNVNAVWIDKATVIKSLFGASIVLKDQYGNSNVLKDKAL